MKKQLLSLLCLCVSASFAAPSFEFSPSKVNGNSSDTISIVFKQDSSKPTLAYSTNLTVNLPAGVSIDKFQKVDASLCDFDPVKQRIQLSTASASALIDNTVACNFILNTTNVTTGEVAVTVNKHEHDFDDGKGQISIPLSMAPIKIGSTTTVPTVHYLTISPANSVVCNKTSVKKTDTDKTVTCTAAQTPNGQKFSHFTGACQGQSSCSFELDSNKQVGAIFVPADTSTESPHPIPSLGILGLLTMITSMIGSVIFMRRRQ